MRLTLSFLKQKKIYLVIIGIVLLLILILFYFTFQKKVPLLSLEKPERSLGYRLVNEKISQSAPIKIFLPPNIDENYAIKNIIFEPQIDGNWIISRSLWKSAQASSLNKEKVIVFKPKNKLVLDNYYLVSLNLPDGSQLKSDFLVVEDPRLLNIFPNNEEAPQNAEITIIFNRPVVPLTTINNPNLNFPVEISPQINGKFRWITTNVLQFTPSEPLKLSSEYTAKVKDFTDPDGLIVKGGEGKFFTQQINLTLVGNVYFPVYQNQMTNLKNVLTLDVNEPLSLSFNQPVDIERTRKEISIIDAKTGLSLPLIFEFATQTSPLSLKEIKPSSQGNKLLTSFFKFQQLLSAKVFIGLENLKANALYCC